ncbi:unnamed protein product [Owenia fusiformis]|uniref:Uncharacterized protein n=1 Tax=Owenia fusiformis TaxID=6347 RepID=A0A8J1TYC7_OWEFU|nr:unnamed protein product [Owenia fusiformis]
MEKLSRPKVGIGIYVLSEKHPGCILLGQRKGDVFGTTKYGLPGGHLEFGEEWLECACRETLEETGLSLVSAAIATVSNVVDQASKSHYIEITVVGYTVGEPMNLEPDKCTGWMWTAWSDLPKPDKLFEPINQLLKLGFNPFDIPMDEFLELKMEPGKTNAECGEDSDIISSGEPSPKKVKTQNEGETNSVDANINKDRSSEATLYRAMFKDINRYLKSKKSCNISPENITSGINNHNDSNSHRPGVGVGAIVTDPIHHPGCVLMGVRKNKMGLGLYAPPGGHLEYSEDWVECAQRELVEECNIKLSNPRFVQVVNATELEKNYHYVTLYIQGELDESFRKEPENLEPEKCEGWEWISWDNFPPHERLFRPMQCLRDLKYDPIANIQTPHGPE